jgi:Na+/H+ antiporter NhaD/arsenite permease-like protein
MHLIRKWLLYITNNEEQSRHEQIFDAAFFVINTVALVFGVIMFIVHDEPQWIPVLIIEYTWALDGMRHNRP